MSELPFMTVFQVLSLLEPCYDRTVIRSFASRLL